MVYLDFLLIHHVRLINSQDIKRLFNTVLDLGSGPGHFSKLLERDKVQKAIMLDSSCTSQFFPRFTTFVDL